MKPVIGITSSQTEDSRANFVNRTYIKSITDAGGLPVLLPLVDDERACLKYLQIIDGLLLTGGVDPDPRLWNEEPIPKLGRIDPDRDSFEIKLTRMALNEGIPILGICRGCQILNVAADGTLIQDLKSYDSNVYKHSQDAPRWYPTHSAVIEKDSQLFHIFGKEEIEVNSFHHQAVKTTGNDFRVTARAKDGVIEAIEKRDKNHFVLGVQWHPEEMWEKNSLFLKLFEWLVQKAGKK